MDNDYLLHLNDVEFDTLWQVLINEQDDIKQGKENPYYAKNIYHLVDKMKKIGGM